MGVVAPERRRAPTPPVQQPPAQPRRPFPWLAVVTVAGLFLLIGGRDWLPDLIPSLPNPFAERTVDRSGPAVLRSIRDLQEFRAATGHFELIVDLEKDTPLPSEILGERTLFVAVGDVDAVVDFSRIGPRSVRVSADRRSAVILLPPVRTTGARLDLQRSYVYDRDRGVFNHIEGVFKDDAGAQREIYLVAQRKLDQAARSSPDIRARAERNTRATLESLLRALGFRTVDVRFAPRPAL